MYIKESKMQGLGTYLNEKKDCHNASTIEDINSIAVGLIEL